MNPKRVVHLFLVAFLINALLLTSIGGFPAQAASPLCYVNDDASGGNTGADWQNAYTNLQSSLNNPNCTEVWVASGIYKPGASGNRTASFQLRSGLAIYGGFKGNETSRDARDWTANSTILSGDLDNSSNHTDNDAYHVVSSDAVNSTAILDGFTITGGYANGEYSNNNGAGMYNSSASPSLTHLIFSNNWTEMGVDNRGGGIYSYSGNPVLTDITFSNNSALWGGGIFITFDNPSLTNITFKHNSAESGGGIYILLGSPNLVDVILDSNSASGYGGGLTNNSGSPNLTNVTFTTNTANYAGGMYCLAGNPNLINITFDNNSANFYGGGLYNHQGNPTLVNVTFNHNLAEWMGGGIMNVFGSPNIINSIFNNNFSGGYGGGLINLDGSPNIVNVIFSNNEASAFDGGGMNNGSGSPNLVNVTFYRNSSNSNGGGLSNTSNGLTLANSIFWGNTAPVGPQIDNEGFTPSISHNDIQGAFASGSWDSSLGVDGGGNLDVDPLFVNALGGDLRLQEGSPVINIGDNTRLPADTSDLDGDMNTTESISYDMDSGLRIVNSVVDLGPYENNLPPTISDISAQLTDEDIPTTAIAFTVGDVDGLAASLTLTANSSSASSVPVTNIIFGGSGANRTVTITPAANQFGIVTITITVSDGELTDTSSFLLTVNPVNDAPVLAAIGDQKGFIGQQLMFTVQATDVDGDELAFSLDPGKPSDAAIDPKTGIFTWNPTVVGTYPITIRVSDSQSPALGDFETLKISVNHAVFIPLISQK